MNPANTSLRQASKPAAFSFQLSPEPPSASNAPVTDDAMDAGWFDPEASVEVEPGDALVAALSDAATQTPPPARALPLPARAVPPVAPEPPGPVRTAPEALPHPPVDATPSKGRTPTLPRPIAIDEPLTEPPVPVTPTSGHRLSELLTAPSEEPAPVVPEPEPARASVQLPKTKPLSFPSDVKPAPLPAPEPAPAPVVTTELEASPPAAPEPAQERPEPREATSLPEPASGAAAADAPGEEPVAVKDTSTFKVIGYALVAMAFSYIGMSALVAWLSDSNSEQAATAPVATTALAAHTDVETSAEAAEAPVSAAPVVPGEPAAKSAPTKPPAQEQVAIEDMPVPAGLALGADKGVLKLVTPDAHSLYVDGEFAGRGPVRIVPVPPGKHTIKTRFDGEEKSYEANVQVGRMTRLTISSAK